MSLRSVTRHDDSPSMTEAEIMGDLVDRKTQAVVDDTAETIGRDYQKRPRFVLQIVERDHLNDDERRASPLELGVIAEQLLNFWKRSNVRAN